MGIKQKWYHFQSFMVKIQLKKINQKETKKKNPKKKQKQRKADGFLISMPQKPETLGWDGGRILMLRQVNCIMQIRMEKQQCGNGRKKYQENTLVVQRQCYQV